MHRVLVALWAMLFDFKTVRIVSTVLTRDVVTVLAVFTCQCDFRTNIVASHCMCLSVVAT